MVEEKKKKGKLWAISFVVLLFAGIAVGVFVGVKVYKANRITATPSNGEMVSLLAGDIYTVVSSYTKGVTDRYFTKEDCFAPKDVVISWDCIKKGAVSYTVKIGTKEDLSDAQSYEVSDRSLSLNTLHSGMHYYYTVTANFHDKGVESKLFDFETEAIPRTISIDGVSNTRDIGGYVTEDGRHRVRQGMVYRGANADGITEAGK